MNYDKKKEEFLKYLTSDEDIYVGFGLILFMIEMGIIESYRAIKNKYFIKDRRK